MRTILGTGLTAALALLVASLGLAEEALPALHGRALGAKDAPAPAVVFLHGGPGYNAVSFELSTAPALATRARVVVYDRAGCGRSGPGGSTSFTFEGALADLARVVKKHGVMRPLLLGHSFGGTLALQALDADPDAYAGVILVGSPVSYPDALAYVAVRCRQVYEAKGNKAGLLALAQITQLDSASALYASLLFQHAMGCGLYAPRKRTAEAEALRAKVGASPDAKYLGNMQPAPFTAFLASEKYTTLDLEPLLEKHATKVFAIYGAEDWALGRKGRNTLESLLPSGHVSVIDGASHSVFADRRAEFLGAVDRVLAIVRAPAEVSTTEDAE